MNLQHKKNKIKNNTDNIHLQRQNSQQRVPIHNHGLNILLIETQKKKITLLMATKDKSQSKQVFLAEYKHRNLPFSGNSRAGYRSIQVHIDMLDILRQNVLKHLHRSSSKCIIQVRNQIIYIFNPNRDTNKILGQTSGLAHCSRYACMRHKARHADEGLHTSCHSKSQVAKSTIRSCDEQCTWE